MEMMQGISQTMADSITANSNANTTMLVEVIQSTQRTSMDSTKALMQAMSAQQFEQQARLQKDFQ